MGAELAMRILDKIIAQKQTEIVRKKMQFSHVRIHDLQLSSVRDLKSALKAQGISIIAEIKRESPSAGIIHNGFDVANIAKTYKNNHADAVSVLTDESYFGGKPGYITGVKHVVDLPVLRKDFIMDEIQLIESRIIGADAVLQNQLDRLYMT